MECDKCYKMLDQYNIMSKELSELKEKYDKLEICYNYYVEMYYFGVKRDCYNENKMKILSERLNRIVKCFEFEEDRPRQDDYPKIKLYKDKL